MNGNGEVIERLRQVVAELDAVEDRKDELTAERNELVLALSSAGWSNPDLRKELGVSLARIGQILDAKRSQARRLLGAGRRLTVAIGGKWETGRTDPSEMISKQAMAAYHTIADAAREFGMSAAYQIVPYKTRVYLNRPNLVVIGSPRIIVNLVEVLESDPYLRFAAEDSDRWHLIERSGGSWLIHRSPQDEGAPADLAYVGRLRRPDGKGLFLYVAGIHACGTVGAAQHLISHLDEIYDQVGNKPWSAIVKANYDPKTRDIVSTDLVTPLYARED